MKRRTSDKLKEIKDPFRGYRKYLKVSDHCEICGVVLGHPSLYEADHVIPKSEFKKQGKRIQHKNNVACLCPRCHKLKTAEVIKTVRYVQSTVGSLLEWYFTDNPEKKFYGVNKEAFE